MKRILFLCLCSALVLPMMADGGFDYPYLVFTTADGSQTAVQVDGLQMSFNDGVLTASNGQQTVTIQVEDLTEMHFAETNVVTSIESETSVGESGKARVQLFDLSGRRVQTGGLSRGVYVMKEGSKTAKICVK